MILGTAGHIDHGKTSLVRALTGVETDRLKEEKARGISIDLGFAYLPVPEGSRLGFVDVPGHERFVHTMLAGAGGIDAALLVVAADDGPMPQTREHLAILDLLGVGRGLVALTKCDLVTPERLAEAQAEIAALLAGTALETATIMPVSNRTGEGLEAIRDALFAMAARHAARGRDGLFRLAVDRVFTLPGAGTVVTGTVLSGAVAVGDRVVIAPDGIPARIRSIHAQNEPAERGAAGDRCALNLAGEGITRDAARRGDTVCAPEFLAPAWRIDTTFRLLASEPKPVGTWMPVRLYHAATDVAGRLVPLSADALAPGETGFAQLVLDAPVAAAVGDRFILRDTSAQRTIGGGRILDLRAPARKRRTPERLAQLAAAAEPDLATSLTGLLAVSPFLVDLAAFGRDRAIRMSTAEALASDLSLKRVDVGGTPIVFARERWTRLVDDLTSRLDAFHVAHPDLMGMGVERLRLSLEPRLPAPAFKAVLQSLAREGGFALEGAWARLASHSVRLSARDEGRWASVAVLLAEAERFRPPRVRDIAGLLAIPEPEVRSLLKTASRLGRVDEIAHDHFFLRRTVSEMVDIVVRLAADGREFTASCFRDRVENGRKVAIQILEFFDRHGVTLRRGDLRRVNPHRLDLFRVIEGGDAAMPHGGEASPVGRPDFKSGRGREPVLGGFDPHSLPPLTQEAS